MTTKRKKYGSVVYRYYDTAEQAKKAGEMLSNIKDIDWTVHQSKSGIWVLKYKEGSIK